MRRAPDSRLLRLAAWVIASLFVLEPALIAAGPCAAGRWLGSASACCCAAAATELAPRSLEEPSSCCTAGTPAETAHRGSPEVGRASCRCELEAPAPLLPTRDPRCTELAGAGALERWIALGALASAEALHPARLAKAHGADPPPRRGIRHETSGAPDLAGSGCARGALASGGTRGLLAIYCSALL